MTPDRERLKVIARRVLPAGSVRRRLARVGRQVLRDTRKYASGIRGLWALAAQPTPSDPEYGPWLTERRMGLDAIRQQARSAADRPPASPLDLVLVDTGDAAALRRTLASLERQTSASWVVHEVDGSTPGAVAAAALDGADPTIVAVAVAGDEFEPDWVFRVTSAAHDDPLVDLVGWDDDVLDNGKLADPQFRPGFSPEVLLGANYLGRSVAYRRRILRSAGGLGDDFSATDDADWWDVALRCDLTAARVARIARILAHLPARPSATPQRRRAVVAAHLARIGGDAELTDTPDGVHLTWTRSDWPTVAIVVPTRHNRTMLDRLLPSLATTTYAAPIELTIVDNGGRTPDHEAYYAAAAERLASATGCDITLRVTWWDEPFNYSRVNNVAAAGASGEVVVFLNDDTEILRPDWLEHLASWAMRPEIGLVGLQLIAPDDTIQHGGVVLGMNGFADHLFEGTAPGTRSMFGPTWWYRNCLSVTAACVAVTRDLFDEIGGFDERFVLCGSDVVLGLDAHDRGLRNVVLPIAAVRHLESATRGTSVPTGDFHASWWRYQKYLRGGDPFFSSCLSLRSRHPALRELDEPGPLVTVGEVLGRSFAVFRQRNDAAESAHLADTCRATDATADAVVALHAETVGRHDVRTVNWHFPDIDSPFYGGINTALRIADTLRRFHGVENRFIVTAAPNESFFRSALAAAFPGLADAPLTFIDGHPDSLAGLPPADVAIATLWTTAYQVAAVEGVRRKFYLVQDFEPMFYPAGTNYALCEEGYRLGLYGLCNTHRLRDLYATRYNGRGWSFMPAIDGSVFHAEGRTPLDHDDVATVFVYARPGHWRNCWELAAPALEAVKKRLGDRVRIVTAGSWAATDDLGSGITHLGLLDYAETGELYRTCDVGVALTVSEHPSYLPLELMACGVPVVAFDNPAGDWILHDDENSLRARRTIDGLADAIGALAADPARRARLGKGALATIAAGFPAWDPALAGIYDYLCDPDTLIDATATDVGPAPR